MNNREYLIELYDIYNELLTEKQREYFENHYFDDLSLNEIGEKNDVSKSLVGKTINIVEEKLIKFEKILKVNEKNKKLVDLNNKITDEKVKEELSNIIYD